MHAAFKRRALGAASVALAGLLAEACASVVGITDIVGSNAGPNGAGSTEGGLPIRSNAESGSDDSAVTGPAPSASFSFVINGLVQTPLTCPSARWQFPSPGYDAGSDAGSCGLACSCSCGLPGACACAGITRVVVVNTGSVAMAYLAQPYWVLGSAYVPGEPTGEQNQLTGVLQPGDQVDITSAFTSGIVALLGSPAPFSPADAGYAGDEGTIPWPAGLPGSGGSPQMWIAEIEQVVGCRVPAHEW
jgi:hypothetical protein